MANETPALKKVGSRREVYTGKAQITAGGLTRNDLFKSERGQIKSIRASFKAKNKFQEQCKTNPEFYKHWQQHRGQLLQEKDKTSVKDKSVEYINDGGSSNDDHASTGSEVPESSTKGKSTEWKEQTINKRKIQGSSLPTSQPKKRKAKSIQAIPEK